MRVINEEMVVVEACGANNFRCRVLQLEPMKGSCCFLLTLSPYVSDNLMTYFPVPNSVAINVLYIVGGDSTEVGINVAHIKEISDTQRRHRCQGER